MAISIADPITLAIGRAKLMTFQPFSVGKWFTLGFIAFLASLGEGGGGSNFNYQGWGGGGRTAPRVPTPAPAPFPSPFPPTAPTPPLPRTSTGAFDDLVNWISSHLAGAVLIGLLALVLIVAISLLVVWISSRGKFMFIEAVAHNTYEVVAPWKRYAALGNSLFGFRAALAVAGLVGTVVILAVALALAWGDIRAKTFGGGATAAILVGVFGFLPFGIFLGLVSWCTDTFVATIMYARGIPVMPAWAEFRQNVLRGNVGSLVLFLLMQIVLGIGMAVAQGLVGCLTCCVGFAPYLSTVFTLPLHVFWRAYSLYFLQQFGPQYVVIVDYVAPTGGFPVMGLPQAYPQGYVPPPPPPPTNPPQ